MICDLLPAVSRKDTRLVPKSNATHFIVWVLAVLDSVWGSVVFGPITTTTNTVRLYSADDVILLKINLDPLDIFWNIQYRVTKNTNSRIEKYQCLFENPPKSSATQMRLYIWTRVSVSDDVVESRGAMSRDWGWGQVSLLPNTSSEPACNRMCRTAVIPHSMQKLAESEVDRYLSTVAKLCFQTLRTSDTRTQSRQQLKT